MERPLGLIAPIPVEEEAIYYNMNHKESGLALIFNHNYEHFEPDLKSKFRSETVGHDCKNLEKHLLSLGFTVFVHSDLTVCKINQVISEAAKENHKDRDCLIVAVLSHAGKKGYLYAKDNSYKLVDLLIPFAADKCPTLAGKPKLLIVQASQGDNFDVADTIGRRTETDSSSNSYKIPVHADFIIIYCDITGSQFVENFFRELRDKGLQFDLLTILTLVKQHLFHNPYIVFQLTRLVRFSRKTPHLQLTASKEEEQNRSVTTKQCKLLQQLFNPKLEARSIDELFYEYNNIISQLSAIDKPVNDGMKVCALLIRLPDYRLLFKKSIENMNISDEMKLSMLLEEFKDLITISSPNTKSYQTDTVPPPLHPVPPPNEISLERKSINFNKDRECSDDDSTADDPSFSCSSCSSVTEKQKYKMDYRSKPLAIIIAQKTFNVSGWKLNDRGCYDNDIALSKTCFMNLGFEVRTVENKKRKEILDNLKRVSREDHSNRSCLAIIVSTHGVSNNCIFARDKGYCINELFKPFHIKNCRTLAGKPKLFFIQACRGELLQSSVTLVHNYRSLSPEQNRGRVFKEATNEENSSNNTLSIELPWPEIEDDFLVFFPSTPEHTAFQNISGSWFITSLCKRLTDNANCDILHILTFVNHDIAINYQCRSDDERLAKKKQMPEVVTKLQKLMILSQ